MKKLTILLVILIISTIGFTACNANQAPIENEEQDNELPINEEGENSSKTWITSIEDTIEIEGMKEPITLNYYDGDYNFITYVPEDMLSVSESADELYKFYANYQGNKNDNVYLELLFFEKGSEKPQKLENFMLVEEENKIYDWALEEYYSADGSIYAMLGKHEDQYFRITMNYPGEFGEGFVPRANKIIENLYWTDTNKFLVERDEAVLGIQTDSESIDLEKDFGTKPEVEVPVDLEVEINNQKSVDSGSSPWMLDPAYVAQVFVSLKISPEGITGEYPIDYDDIKVTKSTDSIAIVEINDDESPICKVYLKRLVKQDKTGIWSVVGYDTSEYGC